MAADVSRFVAAQDSGSTYEVALAELRAGRKRSHWMWFVFPQAAGLGQSPTAVLYGVAGVEEARAYLAHPVLGRGWWSLARRCSGWTGRTRWRCSGASMR